MKGLIVASALVALISGCAPTMTEADVRDVTAADVPIRFAYGQIRHGDAVFKRLADSRTGFTVRRASYTGLSEFAVFDLMESLGDSYFTPKGPGAYIERYFKPDTAIERGGSGTVAGGRQTTWRAFRLTKSGTACVELQRSLREHVEGGLDHYSQALVVGVYCRAGEGQIAPDEARKIATGLSA